SWFPRDGGRSFSQARFASRREAGVRIRDPKQLFCIHSAMEAFAEEQLSLVLLVRRGHAAQRDSGARVWGGSRRVGREVIRSRIVDLRFPLPGGRPSSGTPE